MECHLFIEIKQEIYKFLPKIVILLKIFFLFQKAKFQMVASLSVKRDLDFQKV